MIIRRAVRASAAALSLCAPVARPPRSMPARTQPPSPRAPPPSAPAGLSEDNACPPHHPPPAVATLCAGPGRRASLFRQQGRTPTSIQGPGMAYLGQLFTAQASLTMSTTLLVTALSNE
eukprot:68874-Chlamydomonas_euryale.AAC.3